jgi:hypothetical protein
MHQNQIKQFTKGWTQTRSNDYTVCGSGSLIINCKEWINTINKFIDDNPIKTINDIGCGDLNFVKETNIIEKNIDYLGYDFIVRNTNVNLKRFNKSFNIATDTPRKCDLCICKDVLNHLEMKQILTALENIKRTSKFLMVTNYPNNFNKTAELNNYDARWENINFNIHPYNLKEYLINTIKVCHNRDKNIFISIYKFN